MSAESLVRKSLPRVAGVIALGVTVLGLDSLLSHADAAEVVTTTPTFPHDGQSLEHLSDSDHADLITADHDLRAPEVDPNKVADFVRMNSAVDHALADVNRLIEAYSKVSGPDDAPLRTLTSYRDQFIAAHHNLSLATARVADLQAQFSPHHTTASALRMADAIHIPNPAEFNKTYSLLARFYENLSDGEYVLASSNTLQKDWINHAIPFKNVGPLPQDPIEYLGHIPEKPALIPPRLGFQLDRAIAALPEDVRALNVTAGNGEAPGDAVHKTLSCHYQSPLRCVDLNFLVKTDSPDAIAKVLATMNANTEVDHVNYEVKTLAERDTLRALIMPKYGAAVADHVTFNPNATDSHFHAAFK